MPSRPRLRPDAVRAERRDEWEARDGRGWRWVYAAVACVGIAWFLTRDSAFWNEDFPGVPFLVSCGLAAAVLSGWGLHRQRRARLWLTAPCRVEAVDVRAAPTKGGTVYHPVVHYTYEVAGVEYWSDRVRLGAIGLSDYDAAAAQARSWPEGSAARCFYDPRRPGSAVLDPTVSFRAPLIGMTVSLVLLTGAAYIAAQ